MATALQLLNFPLAHLNRAVPSHSTFGRNTDDTLRSKNALSKQPVRKALSTAGYFVLLVLGCGLSYGGWKVFRFCEFIYTDAYYTNQLQHDPDGMTYTWRDSIGYWSGLTLW
ncbi:MAG: hypothetical protein NTY61_00420, partial [Candidatus Parcubacteria bacterium]|nr:hypothetical protein [Candidatus Parcubacteria bacterium]